MFAITQRVLLNSFPYRHGADLVSIGRVVQDGTIWALRSDDVDVWQKESQTLVEIAEFETTGGTLVGGGAAEYINGALATPNLLRVLGVRMELGRWFTPEEALLNQPTVVVLSNRLWRRYFGSARKVVGMPVRINSVVVTIVGVLPRDVGLPPTADYWMPGRHLAEVVARARSGTSLVVVEQELSALAPSTLRARMSGRPSRFVIVPLHERLYGSTEPFLRILAIAVVFLMVLACANVANLSLARATERRRDFALRATLGASRAALIWEASVENLILALVSALIGLLLARWTTGVFLRLSPVDLSGVGSFDSSLPNLTFAGTLAVFAALSTSAAPALLSLRSNLRESLSQLSTGSARGSSANHVRNGLVIGQLAISLALLMGTVLLLRTLVNLSRIDPGFNASNVVIARLNIPYTAYNDSTRRIGLLQELAARLRTLPGVRAVALGPPPIVGGRTAILSDGFNALYMHHENGDEATAKRLVWIKYVDESYLRTFGIHLRTGRGFSKDDGAVSPSVALINRAAERLYFGDRSGIGQLLYDLPPTVSRGRLPVTVVGVIDNVRQRDLLVVADPEIWLPIAQQAAFEVSPDIAISSAEDAERLLPLVRRTVSEIDPFLATSRLTTIRELIDRTLAPQRFLFALLACFAFLALALATLGLYGVVHYLATRRAREIGIRLALGAESARVVRMMLSVGGRLLCIGVLIGEAVSYALSRLLAGMLFGIPRSSASSALLCIGLLCSVAMIAVFIPAYRAGKTDPMVVLRSD